MGVGLDVNMAKPSKHRRKPYGGLSLPQKKAVFKGFLHRAQGSQEDWLKCLKVSSARLGSDAESFSDTGRLRWCLLKAGEMHDSPLDSKPKESKSPSKS